MGGSKSASHGHAEVIDGAQSGPVTKVHTVENHHGTDVIFRSSTTKSLTRCSRCQSVPEEDANQEALLENKALESQSWKGSGDFGMGGCIQRG